MKLNRRNKLFLGVLGALFLLAVPGRLAWSQRAAAVSDAQAIRTDTDSKRIELARANKAKVNRSKLDAALNELVTAMPSTPDEQSLLDTLAGLATETNVSWEVLSAAVPQGAKAAVSSAATESDTPAETKSGSAPGTTVPAGGSGDVATPAVTAASTPSFSFDATVSGDDASVSAFLERVRTIERLVSIDKVQLTWNKGAGATSTGVSARLSMRAFVWKAGAKAASGSATPATTVSATTGSATSETATGVAP